MRGGKDRREKEGRAMSKDNNSQKQNSQREMCQNFQKRKKEKGEMGEGWVDINNRESKGNNRKQGKSLERLCEAKIAYYNLEGTAELCK